MNNNLQLVLKSSTTEMSLNDHDAGIYIVPELDGLTGLPEIRTTSGVNAGYDGGWTSAQKFDARSIVIRGVIANEDKTEVERMRRELVALLAQGKNGQLELDFVTETGRAYEVQVRTIACDMAMQRVLTQQEFMITLRADDPLIYDNSSAGEEATVNVSGATGGFRIPFEIPLAIDAGSEETVVQNSGLESVAPTIKMYGALHNPKIINHTTNQAMQVEAELGFTEGAWTTPVDAPEGTNVSFEPEREAPIESVKLKGGTYQQTYPGKNLLKPYGSPAPISGYSGLSATLHQDGSITLNGTATADAWIEFGFAFQPGTQRRSTALYSLDSASTYTLSSTVSGTRTGSCWLYIQITSSGTEKERVLGDSTSFTGADGIYRSWLRIASGASFTNVTIYPQLEKSSSATSWEPYVGGISSPNSEFPQLVQVTTGENMVKVYGKNMATFPTGTKNGITCTRLADGGYRLNGTASGGIAKFMFNLSLESTAHTMSYTSSSANNGVILRTRTYQADGFGTIQDDMSVNSTSGSVTSSKSFGQVMIDVANGTVLSNFIIYIQLEFGSTASAFEPCREQAHEINLGKNLYDKSTSTDGYRLGADGTPYADAPYTLSGYIPVMPNTTYTISFGSVLSNPSYTNIASYGSDKTFIYRWSPSQVGTFTLTTQAGAHYLRVATPLNRKDSTQCELGPTATTYASYFTPIELCKLTETYQDYIYKKDGKWYKHKMVGKYIFTGTTGTGGENWYVSGGAFKCNELNTIKGHPEMSSEYAYQTRTTTQLYSNYGTVKAAADIYDGYANSVGLGNKDGGGGNTDAIYVSKGSLTLNGWNALLSATPLICYYALRTPVDEEITESNLIAELESMVDGSAVVYQGETHIFATSAWSNVPVIAAIRYYTDKEPDQRDELIVDSRLKTITLNGLDVYHLKTEGSEFPMLAPGENKLSLQSDITGDNGYAKVSYKQGYLSI